MTNQPSEWAMGEAKQVLSVLFDEAHYMPCPYSDPHDGSREAKAERIIALALDAARNEHDSEYAGNLLAVIHGDGGHYIQQHGWKKATDDAIEKWYAARNVPEGCVRLPDGSDVVCLTPSRGPRLHRTTDGAIVPDHSCYVWTYERMGDGRFTGKIITMHYGTWFATKWDDYLPPCWYDKAPDGEWGCYSTREAAEAARKDANP